MSASDEVDFIVVGAGSAGCTLANRLTEDRTVQVRLIEAGGWDRDPFIHIPLGFGRIYGGRMHDWKYSVEPEPEMNNREIGCARGKIVGGSSSINALSYARGHSADYDRWANNGLPEWSFSHVLPYFRRQESWEDGDSTYRGGSGPLTTQWSRFEDPLLEAYLQAGDDLGHPKTDDYNGGKQEGFARSQTTIRNGRRCSAATAYLRPALSRKNLQVMTRTLVTRVIIENGRAKGIEYERNGKAGKLFARREVILAGGAINSPQLLKLSGIGSPEELATHDIAVKVPLRGVGENLQDHLSAYIAWHRPQMGPFVKSMRADKIATSLAGAYLFGKGPAADLPGGHLAFLKSDPSQPLPDYQVLFIAGVYGAHAYLSPFVNPPDDMWGCRVVLLRPESRGRVLLRSADPRAPVRIYQNFLKTDRDWATLRAGIKTVRDLARQPALRSFLSGEAVPAPDADMDAHIRATAQTVNHPACTCKMGSASDEMAVVDGELKVIGVDGLRVVDASVMPDLVGGHINGPVIMIAEKAADMIRGKPSLAPTPNVHT